MAVGALHLPGEEGVIELLRARALLSRGSTDRLIP